MSRQNRGIEALAEVVAPQVLLDAIETSQRLASLGIPHALIGGLAVGLHGHPRATKDVDYLVSDDAFEMTEPILVYKQGLKDIVRIGVIDLMGVPPSRRSLLQHLTIPQRGEIPVIPVEALILLKLDAGRPQDIADIQTLIGHGTEVKQLLDYIKENAPEHLNRLSELLDEEKG